jgi:hypothetical protein
MGTMSNQKNTVKSNTSVAYTTDSEFSGTVEVPSITKLLNRKSLKVSQPPARPPQEPTKTITNLFKRPEPRPSKIPAELSPPEIITKQSADPVPDDAPITLDPGFHRAPVQSAVFSDHGSMVIDVEELRGRTQTATTAPEIQKTPEPQKSVPVATPAVQAVKAGPRGRAGSPLIVWDLGKLKRSSDPLGKALAHLMESGAKSALFLTIAPPPPGSPVPHFFGTAAVTPSTRQPIWTGLKWDPTLIPEMWNHFVRAGFVELPPPGTMTSVESARNVVRGAFGCVSSEWLTLIRIGPQNSCRGVAALISEHTLAGAAAQVQSLLTSMPKVKKAA